MNVKGFLLVSLAILAAAAFISTVGAHDIYISPYTYFGLAGNAYINFNEVQLVDFVFKSGNSWQFVYTSVNRIITTTANMTILKDEVPLWFNYTVDGAGEQDINFVPNVEPTYAVLDGVAKSEFDGWVYSVGWLNVTGATSSAAFYFASLEPEPPIPPQFGEMGLGGMNFYFINGSKLCIQQEGYNLTLTVTSGTWNGTAGYIEVLGEDGYLTFDSVSNFTLTCDDKDTLESLSFDSPNYSGGWNTGQSRLVYDDDAVRISWGKPIMPLFPILAIVGIVGLVTMLAGPTYGIYQIKEGDYIKGIRSIVVFGFLGLGCFLAWLGVF